MLHQEKMVVALIVAAGKGTRMGGPEDKLFLPLAGAPLIVHTWRRFDQHPEIGSVILVVRHECIERYHQLAGQSRFHKPYQLVPGGAERQDSVWNGLQALSDDVEMVAIQDGARPLTSERIIHDTIAAARETGAAVAARPVTDTIKESLDDRFVKRTLDRTRLWAVQTPQIFQVPVIRQAIQTAKSRGLTMTDDTAACELIGHPIRLVESFEPNPKATSPDDLPLLEHLLRQR